MSRSTSPATPGSLASLFGLRWRDTLDSTLPGVAFVIGWLASGRSIVTGVIAAVSVGVVMAVVRRALGASAAAVLFGLLMVTVAVIVVLFTGRAADFFLPRLLLNVASALLFLVSIAAGRPLLGGVVGVLLRQKGAWRRDPDLRRAYSLGSWAWAGVYTIRSLVFGLLYYAAMTEALAVAQVALGWPLVAAGIAISAGILARTLPAGHPGFRHPRPAPEPEPETEAEAAPPAKPLRGPGRIGRTESPG